MLFLEFEPIPLNWDTGGINRGDLVTVKKTGTIGQVFNIVESTIGCCFSPEKQEAYNDRSIGPNELFYFVYLGDNQIEGYLYKDIKLEYTG